MMIYRGQQSPGSIIIAGSFSQLPIPNRLDLGRFPFSLRGLSTAFRVRVLTESSQRRPVNFRRERSPLPSKKKKRK